MAPLPLHVDPVLSQAMGAVLAVVLLAGAGQKLRARDAFAAALAGYGLLPASTVGRMAWLLPLSEALAGALLLFPSTRLAAAWLAFALLALVSAAMTINLLRGHADIACGCGGLGGGVGDSPISWGLVARNLVLIAALPWIAAEPTLRELVWVDYLTAAGAILALLGLYALVSQLLATQPRLGALRNS